MAKHFWSLAAIFGIDWIWLERLEDAQLRDVVGNSASDVFRIPLLSEVFNKVLLDLLFELLVQIQFVVSVVLVGASVWLVFILVI